MHPMHPLDRLCITHEEKAGRATFGFLARLGGAPPSRAEVADLVTERLAGLPRLRCRRAGTRWRWTVGDPADPDTHVTERSCAARTETGLWQEAADLLGRSIPTDTPPWRVELLHGYAPDESALLFRVNHALLDGISMRLLLGHLLTDDATSPPAPHPQWLHEPATRQVPVTPRNLRALAASQSSPPGTGLPFNRPLGPGRHLTVVSVPRRTMEAARPHPQTTLNDVFLASVGGAMRRMAIPLPKRPAYALMPVSLRTAETAHVLGNQVSSVKARLPLGQEAPAARLAAAHRTTSRIKRGGYALGTQLMVQGAGAAGAWARHALMKASWYPATSTLVCSNVPALDGPLGLVGRPVLDIAATTLLNSPHGLCTMLHGYADTMTVTVLANGELADLADVFAKELRAEFDELVP